jgi:hypothetical protein
LLSAQATGSASNFFDVFPQIAQTIHATQAINVQPSRGAWGRIKPTY